VTTRTITIVCHGGNHFDVFEGERYADHLCWDEMLGQVAELTHPSINRGRYRMETPEEGWEREERLKAAAARAKENAA